MEPVVALLILKLGDGQARIREAALAALSGLARAPSVGPTTLSHYALRKMPKKQLSSWRAVHARIMLLKKLVEVRSFHPGPSSLASISLCLKLSSHHIFTGDSSSWWFRSDGRCCHEFC